MKRSRNERLNGMAGLQVRKRAEKAAAEERKALLGEADPMARQQKLLAESDFVGAAEDTTNSLQRTRQMIAQVCCPSRDL